MKVAPARCGGFSSIIVAFIAKSRIFLLTFRRKCATMASGTVLFSPLGFLVGVI